MADSLTIDRMSLAPAFVIGHVTHVDDSGTCRVDFPGATNGAVEARLTATAAERLAGVRSHNAEVLLVFEEGQLECPVVLDVLATSTNQRTTAEPTTPSDTDDPRVFIDGQEISLRAEKELELRCGRASITLKRNGKIILKGDHLLSYSRGTNRIRGGSVKIN